MFKVSRKKDAGEIILTPAWDKTSSRRIKFKGFKTDDSNPDYFYIGFPSLAVNEAKEWKKDESEKKGEYVDVKDFPNGAYLRLQKRDISYRDNTVKVNEWDTFFINLFK